MMDQPTFEREINAYLISVDALLDGRRLLDKKGTAILNPVQKEVDMTLNNLRSIQRTGLLDRIKTGSVVAASLKRAELHADRIISGTKVPLSGIFGSLSTESIFTSPAWKDSFSRVSAEVSNFTNTYGALISNMDSVSRAKIDKALATIIDNAQASFNSNSTDAGASRYLKDSLQSLKALEGAAQSQQVMSVAAMLQVLVQEKDQERVKLLANMKLIEAKLSAQQITVVNNASRRAMEKLDAILGDKRSYDAAIRSRKLKLVDSDLDIMRRIVQNTSFSNDLGNLPPPRSAASKLGRLNKHQATPPFRGAPSSNLGGGLGVSFKTIKLVDPMASPHDILATVRHNSMILNAQGGLTPEQRPIFLRQINSLTKESYGGNITSLKEAQKQYRLLLSADLGSMTQSQIKAKHPKGTKQGHIKKMHELMQEGEKFGPAHKRAVEYGFSPGSLGGILMYDQDETSLINGVRLLGSLMLYLVIPSTAIYIVGSQIASTKKSKALEAMLGGGEE